VAVRINIPRYTSKDAPIMVGSMTVLTLILNYIVFDNYFSDFTVFLWSTLTTFFILIPAFIFYGMIAISLRNRFPDDSQTFKRLIICIGVFLLLSAVVIAFFLLVYETVHFFGYEFSEQDYTHCYLVTIVMNVFLTFLNEGISQFERYKVTLVETEQLKKEYLHSQLLGLKSQMNPHFLFNSLNTLSCLIQEDEEKAEDFLDHMSKVYRYLLRNNEDQLVSLRTEIDMVRSYYFLLKKRHSEALSLSIEISEKHLNKEIPPLTLQMIVENAVNQNSLTKNEPLNITIRMIDEEIEIEYNKQPKLYGVKEGEEAIENILNKFRLLTQKEIEIFEENGKGIIRLPLMEKKELTTV
jgi:two-component system, LytTR family, sensor kinase